MSQFVENTFISEFNILPDMRIAVRKTIQVHKVHEDGEAELLSEKFWRRILEPNDVDASTVLDDPVYLGLAQSAWASLENTP